MTRVDAFAKEWHAMATRAEAAGWEYDKATHTWFHGQHTRRYASLMQLFEEKIQTKGETL